MGIDPVSFRLMTSVLDDGALLLEGDGRILGVNAAFCALSGFGREELLGVSAPFPFVRVSNQRWQELCDASGGEFDETFCRKEGGSFGVSIRVATEETDGPPRRVLIVKPASGPPGHGLLRDPDDRLRLVGEAVCGVIFDWDFRAERIERSAGLAALLGFRPDEADPTHEWWLSRIHPLDLTGFLATVDRARRPGGERQHGIEYRVRHKEGHYLWIQSRAVTVRDESGRAYRLVGSHVDTTDRRRAEQERDDLVARERAAREELERANRAKDEFIAVLSHELRTPLTPVLTTAQMMERDPDLTPRQREAVVMVRRNVELEVRLIDDLLDLTRISRGKLELFPALTDVHRNIGHALGICESEARSKRLSLHLELSARSHHVRADAARLQQVLWNLLKNAVKFTPEAGTITLRTENVAGDAIRIEVRDTGVGIAPQVLPTIFDAFVQGGREVTRRHGGLGLGLTISRKLVEMHGGTLAAFSEGEGRGSTFTLHLPLASGSIVEEPRPRPPSSEPAQARAILLVEDHRDTATAMTRLLRHSGYEVRTADSVASALRAADAGAFDLMICDIGLPDGSGLDLMRQLLARRPVKGIALSGFGTEDDVRRSREAGFLNHLTKPVDVARLEALIRQSLAEAPA